MEKKRMLGASFFGKYWLLLFTVGVVIVFGLISPEFLSLTNLTNILSGAGIQGIMAIGLTCIFATGELDFSAGSQVSLACCLIAVLISKTGMSHYFLGMVIVLGVMIGIGCYNSFLHVKVGIPAFIATLGSNYIFGGFAKAATNSQNLYNLSMFSEVFTFLGQGYLFGVIPMPLVMLVMVAAAVLFYTEYTRAGKYLYSVGSNPKACEYMGIDARAQKLRAFVISTVCCGLAGILQSSQMNQASPTYGANMFVPALTAVFLGATFGRIGVFNVPGTIVGAVLYAVVNRGLLMITSELWLKYWIQGGMLLMALIIVVLIKKKESGE